MSLGVLKPEFIKGKSRPWDFMESIKSASEIARSSSPMRTYTFLGVSVSLGGEPMTIED